MINVGIAQAQTASDMLAAISRALKDPKQFTQDVETLQKVYDGIISATITKQQADSAAEDLKNQLKEVEKVKLALVEQKKLSDAIMFDAKCEAKRITGEALALINAAQETKSKLEADKIALNTASVTAEGTFRAREAAITSRENQISARETAIISREKAANAVQAEGHAMIYKANETLASLRAVLPA